MSLQRNEEGLNKSKDNWFKSQHRNWATKNQGVLEVAHMSAEHFSQMSDPRQVNLYQRKETDDTKALQPTLTLEDGTFRQKEKFKFKDFTKDSQKGVI